MKKPFYPLLGAVLALGTALALCLFSACPNPQVDPNIPVIQMLSSQGGEMKIETDLGPTPRDLYLVFGNPTEKTASKIISVKASGLSTDAIDPTTSQDAAARSLEASLERAGGNPALGRFKPFVPPISRMDILKGLSASGPSVELSDRALSIQSRALVTPNSDAVGSTKLFIDGITLGSLAATCRYVSGVTSFIDFGNDVQRKLSIWVADEDWAGSNPAVRDDSQGGLWVTQAMVDALAERFFGEAGNPSSSIYAWLTNIIGQEWGDLRNVYGSDVIPRDDCITILLYDIEDDNSPDGGILGFFWAANNFTVEGIGQAGVSNERIMFCLDAVMFANPDDDLFDANPATGGTDWAETDPLSTEIFSTLAHEFQHMIHFYQKDMLRTRGIDTDPAWTDEMCSLLTEDLLADKLAIDGPRGVAYNDYSAGSPGNQNGRLPLYNYAPFYGIAGDWNGDENAAIRYSPAYALGAYLARNYGGAEFLRKVVQTSSTGKKAVEDAAAELSGGLSFDELFRRWPAAALVSDSTTAPHGFRYNTGGAFSSTVNGIEYRLGSINLWNYRFTTSTSSYDGPVGLNLTQFNADSRLNNLISSKPMGLSNSLLLAASDKSGKVKLSIEAPAGTTITVIAR